MNDSTVVAKAAGTIVILTIVSKVLGFVREMALAYVFGASAVVDAYQVALTVPNILFTVVGGALSVVAVPLFASYAAEGNKEEAWRVFGIFSSILSLLLIGFILLGVPLSRQIVWLVAPGLEVETAQLAAGLMAFMLPGVLFFCLANLFYGLLNANKIFGPPALGPAVLNVCVILSTTAGLKYGITAVAVGNLTGFLACMLLQVPFLRRAGFRWHWSLNIHHPGVKQAISMMVPLMIGTGISQVYIIIDRILASGLVEGSISALNYANKLVFLPQGVIVMALGTAIFPTLANRAAGGFNEEFNRAVSRSLKLVMMAALPCVVGLAVLREPIVKLLFMRGAFDQNAVVMTAFAVLCFSFGLLGQSLNPVLTRGFYALQDTVTPVKVGVATVVLNLAFSLLLIGPLKHGGLALANSIAATFNFLVLLWLISRKTGGKALQGLGRFAGGVVLASMVTGLVAWGAENALVGLLKGGTLFLALRLLVDAAAGGLAFAVICRVLRLDEYMYIRMLLRRIVSKIMRAICPRFVEIVVRE